MNSLTRELHDFLLAKGASLCGFADLRGIADGELTGGVSVAIAISPKVLKTISQGPSRIYFDTYHALNARLDGLVTAGADFLRARGYHADDRTRAKVTEHEDYRTDLPHKTVATRAGLGWIGKSALLINPEFGPAIRLSSLLTDAPLSFGMPVNSSKCGSCNACKEHCPGHAVSGKLWDISMDRKEFFDAGACRQAARALSKSLLDEEISLCGKCIEVCPYTKRYIKKEENENQVGNGQEF